MPQQKSTRGPPPAEEDEGQQFIRPTQGLKLRQAGGLMQVNLENIGGRILYMEEMNGHKNRMKDIKPVIQLAPPWGSKGDKKPKPKAKAQPNKPSAAPPKRAASGPAQRPSRPAAGGRMGPQDLGTDGQTAEFEVSILNEEHQQLYHDFVKMLCLMGNEDSRAILEQAYRESEEKKLLSGYTGIFPSLDNEEDEDDDVLEEDSHRPLHGHSMSSSYVNEHSHNVLAHSHPHSETPHSAYTGTPTPSSMDQSQATQSPNHSSHYNATPSPEP
uniref:Uncharacterized protein n=1 Tax=Eutreptiella gymnastica TaxID=73025 RepID=A0A7S1IZR6_9EUGL